MQDWLTARVNASPGALALVIGEERWTYGELDGLVQGVYGRLQQTGVQPGDFVAVLLPNNLAYVCLIHALARLGAVLVPLNTRLTPAELEWQLEHVGCDWLIYGEGTADEWLMDHDQRLMVNDDWLKPTAFTIHNSQTCPEHAEGFTIDHLQAVVFTSGTSGRPKGVTLTFANHFYSAMGSAYRLGVRPDDLWLSCLPLYHVGGLAVIFRSCLYGTAVDLHPRFNLAEVNRSLDNKPITLISVVPTMLRRLLQSRDYWPASLRLILLGGAAAPAELIRAANGLPRAVVSGQYSVVSGQYSVISGQYSEGSGQQKLNTDNRLLNTALVAPTYGLTEAASQVATMRPEAAAQKPGCVGKPLLFTQVKIVDEKGEERPPGEIGEIVVTGPTVTPGYFARDWQLETGERNQPPIATIHTGDLGYLDEDGDLWVALRQMDLIVTGGENVAPAEVEEVLGQHTAVTAACVVGIEDPEWGQKVAALVVLTKPGAVTAEALIAWCRERLAGYKIPRLIRFTDHLPQTASGKIARKAARQYLTQPKTNQANPPS